MSKTIRKALTKSKSVDSTCSNHGSCPWCANNRKHKVLKLEAIAGNPEEDILYNNSIPTENEVRKTLKLERKAKVTLHEDGSVSIEGDVNLRDRGLTKLSFICSDNQLLNLEFAPTKVEGASITPTTSWR